MQLTTYWRSCGSQMTFAAVSAADLVAQPQLTSCQWTPSLCCKKTSTLHPAGKHQFVLKQSAANAPPSVHFLVAQAKACSAVAATHRPVDCSGAWTKAIPMRSCAVEGAGKAAVSKADKANAVLLKMVACFILLAVSAGQISILPFSTVWLVAHRATLHSVWTQYGQRR